MVEINRRGFMTLGGVTLALGALPALARTGSGPVRVADPRVEYMDCPLGLEVQQPVFSWRMESAQRGSRQTAYRILVAHSEQSLRLGIADAWDSGRVESDRCFDLRYEGPALRSRQRCWWRVEVWDHASPQPVSSDIRWWEMGLLEPSDWMAGWIAAEEEQAAADQAAGLHWIWGEKPISRIPHKFRYRFELPAPVRDAQLLISGKEQLLGVWANGNSVPVPESISWSRMLALQLTNLQPGSNLLAVSVAAPPGLNAGGALAALLRLQLEDGRVLRLVTGSDWRTSMVEDEGWMHPAYDDATWLAAVRPRRIPNDHPWPPAPAVLLRREFDLQGRLRQARLYSTALGAYEARINGRMVGDACLAPEPTDPGKRLLYQVHDVTTLLRQDKNVLGAMVGDGWYASQFSASGRYHFGPPPRRWRAQLELSYEDGSVERITTDGDHWRLSPAPVLSAEIYDGERHDARLEQPGWDTVGFDDRRWMPALVAAAPTLPITAQPGPKIRRTQRLKPVAMRRLKPGVHLYDFGQNFAGWVRLRVRGPAGSTVQLCFGETLHAAGTEPAEAGAIAGGVDQRNLRTAKATDTYVLRGDPRGETWEPRFTYHGFRYVEMHGFPGKPTLDSLEGVVVHSDLPLTGSLSLSNPLLQQIWRNSVWSQRSNFFGLPTDCPQRDERLGWLGDAQVFWDAAAFNMDVDAFTHRFMDDVRAAQNAEGAFPDAVPPFMQVMPQGSPGWGDGGVILPWTVYQRYGDRGIIERNWKAMQRWSQYVLDANPDFLWRKKRGSDFGDWLAVDAVNPSDVTTPKDLIGTAFWAYSTELLRQMAEATGRSDDATRLAGLRRNIETAFVQAYVQADGRVGNGSQTGQVLALRFGLLPADLRSAAAEHLADEIRRRGTRLSTGFLGTPYLLDALADHGHEQLACSLLLQSEYPSWGYMIRKGATSMWERWNGDTGDIGMNSYNHYAFGAVTGFLFRRLAGIDAAVPGFRRVLVRPIFDPRLPRGGGEYLSVMGRIATDWRQSASGAISLRLTVPANASAVVHLPVSAGAKLSESGRGLGGREGLRLLEQVGNTAVVETGSGSYHFRTGR